MLGFVQVFLGVLGWWQDPVGRAGEGSAKLRGSSTNPVPPAQRYHPSRLLPASLAAPDEIPLFISSGE